MKIAILVTDLTLEYNSDVIEGITSFFKKKKDVQTIIAPVNIPAYENDSFEYQYWSSIDVLQSKEIDAYVVIPNTFGSNLTYEELASYLKKYNDKPVFTVGLPLNLENNYYTVNSCQNAYEEVIKHLKEKHNCSKIGFFTAAVVNSVESEQRFEAYKNALKKNNLEYNPEFVFDGDFTPGYARDLFLKKFKSKKDIKFDALLCANDYTAAGCLWAFDILGVKIPEDVILVGFDNTEVTLVTYPTLSTIDQYVIKSGEKIAQMAYDVVSGKKCSKKKTVESIPIYRQSCGCINSKVHSSSYVDKDGNYFENDENAKSKNLDSYRRFYDYLNGIYKLLDKINASIDKEDIQNKMFQVLNDANISEISVYLYDDIVTVNANQNFKLPSQASLFAYYSKEKDELKANTDKIGVTINPFERLMPDFISDSSSGVYTLVPIFLQDKNYGYMICKFQSDNYTLVSIYYKILVNIIVQAFEFSKTKHQKEQLVERNQNLTLQSKTDELTQIFNRRGIIEYGQRLIELSSVTGKDGSVFFCDMDGLKKINDVYGHKIGDLAIKTEAEILKKSFRDTDLVGRLSGDEFAIIAPGFKLENFATLRERLNRISEEASKNAGLPFILSLSIGIVEFNESKKDLEKLLLEADKKLYLEKEEKHKKRGV